MLVVATAGATRFGGIAAALAGNEVPSAFERGIHRLGLLIMRLTIFLTLFVLLDSPCLRPPRHRVRSCSLPLLPSVSPPSCFRW